MLVNKTEKCRLTDPPTRNCSADKKVIRFDDDDEVDDEDGDGDETQERTSGNILLCGLCSRPPLIH